VERAFRGGLGLDVVAARVGPVDSHPAFGVGVEDDGSFFVAVAVAFADDRDFCVGGGLAVGEDAEAGSFVDVHIVGVGALEAEFDSIACGLEDGVAGLAERDKGDQAAAAALAERELGFAGHVLGFELFECAAPANHLPFLASIAAREGGCRRGLRCGLSATLASLTTGLLAAASRSLRGGTAALTAALDSLGLSAGAATLLGSGGGGDLLNAVGAWVNEFEFEATAEAAVERIDEFAWLAVGASDADLLDGDGSAVGVEEEVGSGGLKADPARGFAEDGLAGDDPRAGGLGSLHKPERGEECDEGGGDRRGAITGVAKSHDSGGGSGGGCVRRYRGKRKGGACACSLVGLAQGDGPELAFAARTDVESLALRPSEGDADDFAAAFFAYGFNLKRVLGSFSEAFGERDWNLDFVDADGACGAAESVHRHFERAARFAPPLAQVF